MLDIKQIWTGLKLSHGSITMVAQTVGVSMVTISNILKDGLESDFKDEVIRVATPVAIQNMKDREGELLEKIRRSNEELKSIQFILNKKSSYEQAN